MEEEIDLRPYIEAVTRNWLWIIGAAVLMAIVAVAITFLRPPSYKATALVAVTAPRQVIQFDPRITSAEEDLPFDAYPDLATSDELLVSLLAEISSSAPDLSKLQDLRHILTAEAGSDPSLLNLSAEHGDPEVAAAIANRWAELFVVKANAVFGAQGGDQLQFFENQLDSSFSELELSEEALIDFQAGNRSYILENELLALQQTQADQLAKRRQILLVAQDAAILLQQLSNTGSDGDLSSADQLAAVLLQLRAFSGVPAAEVSVPWQLQVNMDQISTASVPEQVKFLASWQELFSEQTAEIDARLMELEPQIFEIQKEKQQADVEEARLTRNYEIAESTYTALANKVQEEQITSQDQNSGVRLASRSAVPSSPESSGRWIIMIIGAVFGGLIAIIWIVARTWRRANKASSPTETNP